MTNPFAWNRRQFIQYSSTVASSATLLTDVTLGAEQAKPLPTADQFIAGKDKRLLVHSVKTGEIETPLALLRDHPVTPKELLFVRNNQLLPDTLTLEAAEAGDWQVEFSGLLEAPRTVKVAELERMPQKEMELVLQCSGNSRSRFAKTVKAEGVSWQHGAMGNVVFRGVPLKAVVEHCGAKIKSEARYVTAEGKDLPVMPGTADFEHSLPLDEALDKTLLALTMNGEPLPKVHGGPVRLVTPGYYATMNVKWVSRLCFEARESINHHHLGRYRTPLEPIPPGTEFSSTLENSEPNWNMRIKSVIFAPLDGASVSAGKVEIRGVAWNDGTAAMEAVELSTDGGATWRRAELSRPSSPFAWHRWKLAVQLDSGKRTILSRAVDALGRTQPLDGSIGWNPAGYAWNGVDAVDVTVG